jgi:hypothetical protein
MKALCSAAAACLVLALSVAPARAQSGEMHPPPSSLVRASIAAPGLTEPGTILSSVSLARIDSLAPGSVFSDQPPGSLDTPWEPLPARSFESHFRWGPAILSTMGFTTLQAIGRLPNETTRRNLDGPFLNDWFEAAAGLFDNNWSDGNKVVTNYVAHPVGGSVYGNIARQNSKYRGLLPGDEGYVKGLMLGLAWSAVASLNHEIGPISEASFGNIGQANPNQQGWVDPVVTPLLGTAWMVLEDLLYKHIVSKIEGRNAHHFWHCVLNPSRSTANVFGARKPWAR